MESETDTEEFEKVSQTPSESQHNADNAAESEVKVQAVEFGTCTDEIETKNSETMTEVRTNQFLVGSQSLHKISNRTPVPISPTNTHPDSIHINRFAIDFDCTFI